jgi:hypothetical protein
MHYSQCFHTLLDRQHARKPYGQGSMPPLPEKGIGDIQEAAF